MTSTATAPPTTGRQPVPQGAPQQGTVANPGSRSMRARLAAGDSAQRVVRISVATTVVCLLVAVLGFVGAQRQAAGMDRAATGTDRVLTVMAVRNALLEADGAATNAFLVGGLEPQDRRELYDQAIDQAARLLTQLAEGADEDADLIADLNADLATYTSLVEAARVNNRQGFPVGAAYLDQASTLVRDDMLVDLDAVLAVAADDAAAAFGSTSWTILVIGILVLAVVVMVVLQARLARMTHRRLNLGLALATVLLVIAFIAGGLSSMRAAESAAAVRTDTYRPTLAIAQARVLAAEARTLESFTLIKRGSGQAYEEAFLDRTGEAMRLLEDVDAAGLDTQLQTWLDRHAEIRSLDDSGDWDGAVDLAVTDADDGPSAAYTAFVDSAAAAVDEGSAEVTSTVREAGGAARTAAWVLAIAGAIAAVACWRGTAARREEYR